MRPAGLADENWSQWPRRNSLRDAATRSERYGVETLSDFEHLALLLERPDRADAAAVAGRLIDAFGNFAGAVSAPPERLIDLDVDQPAALQLRLVAGATARILHPQLVRRHLLDTSRLVRNYCTARIAYEAREVLLVLYLDRRRRLILDERHQHGTLDHVPLYPREVLRRCLFLGAAGVILAHNHPSGVADPSRDDVLQTLELRDSLKVVGIALHDHVVVARERYRSMRAMGVLADG
jgi:DNA repair protein RadC